MAPCNCFTGLVGRGRARAPAPLKAPAAAAPPAPLLPPGFEVEDVVFFSDEASKQRLRRMVREEIAAEVVGIQGTFIQELRSVEVRLSRTTESKPQSAEIKRYLNDVETLNRQILHLEHAKNRRNMELGALRTALTEYRRASIDKEAPADSKRRVEEAQLLEEIRDERDSRRAERRRLEEQIRELEAEMQKPVADVAADPEKDRLKRSVKQLQMSIESRDRYACWVCNQRAQPNGEKEDSDDDEEPCVRETSTGGPSPEHEDEVATMKHEIQRMRRELRQFRGSVSTPSSQSPTPTMFRRRDSSSSRHGAGAEEAGEEEGVEAKTLSFMEPEGQEVEPASDLPMRESRGRIPVPSVGEETNDKVSSSTAHPPRVKFSQSASLEETEAGPSALMRCSRNRIPTPFVMVEALEGDLPSGASRERRPSFASDVSEVPAEVPAEMEAAAMGRRSSRDRIATPFVTPDSVPSASPRGDGKAAKTVAFSESVSTEDPAVDDESPNMGTRHCRNRISTPFILPDSVMEEPLDADPSSASMQRPVTFSEEVSAEAPPPEAEAAEPGPGTRSSRGRIATPFVAPDALQEGAAEADGKSRAVNFSAEVAAERPPPCSVAGPLAGTRPCRSRIATPFVSREGAELPEEAVQAREVGKAAGSVKFSDVVDKDEEEAPSSRPAGRRIRDRVPTGFVRGDALEPDASPSASPSSMSGESPSRIKFRPRVSVALLEGSSSVRRVDSENLAMTGEEQGEEEEEDEAEAREEPPSFLQVGKSREERRAKAKAELASLQAEDESSGPAQGGVRFAEEASEGNAASVAEPGHARSIRGRTPTGFVRGEAFQRPEEGVHFSEAVAVSEAASQIGAGLARSVRGRTPTGFVAADQLPPENGARLLAGEGGGVRFDDHASDGEAASLPVAGARSVRGRTPTGFVGADALRDADGRLPEAAAAGAGVRFAAEVATGDAASSPAAAGAARSVRGRTPTGFVSSDMLPEEAVGRREAPGVRFAAGPELGDAASSPAAAGVARSVRGRTPTGFVGADALAEADGPRLPDAAVHQGVRFGATAVEAAASSPAASGTARSVRGRVQTGFVREDVAPEDELRLPASREGAGVRFAEDASDGDAASSPAAPGVARSLRGRTPTGFVGPDVLLQEDSRFPGASEGAGVRFAEDASVGDAASSVAETGARRSVRGRTPTGFISSDALPPEETHRLPGLPNGTGGGGVRFDDAVDVEDAASSPAAPGSRRSVRGRTATGFITSDALPEEDLRLPGPPTSSSSSGVRFAEDVDMEDAASSPAAPGSRRSVRGRTPTGFISSDALPVDEGPRLPNHPATSSSSGVRFAEDVAVEDAASSPAAPGSRRSVRGRAATGFVGAGDLPPEEGARLPEPPAASSSSGVRFAEDVATEDAASSPAAPGSRRSVRGRTPTGFISSDVLPPDEGPRLPDLPATSSSSGVRFAEDVAVEDAASSPAAPGARRSVRARTPTGFVGPDALLPDEGPRLPDPPATSSSSGVRFAEEIAVEDAASSPAAPGSRRSVRGRQATGFVGADALPPEEGRRLPDAPPTSSSSGVRFAEDTEVEDAASSPAAPGSRRSLRGRTPTGFVGPDALPPDEGLRLPVTPATSSSSGVRFAAEVAVEDAASSPAAPGLKRSVRGRDPTGFIGSDALPPDEGPRPAGVRFAEAPAAEGEAASEAPAPGSRRSVRGRTPTGFISSDVLPDESPRLPGVAAASNSGVHFSEDVAIEDAASSPAAPGSRRSVRGRAPTGFVGADALPEMNGRLPELPAAAGVHFAEAVDVEDAASSPAAAGVARSLRGRTPTGFVSAEMLGEAEGSRDAHGDGVRFSAEVSVGDAASSSVAGGGRSVRGRAATGFLHEAELPEEEARLPAMPGTRAGVHFSESVSEGMAASSPAAAGAARSVRGRTPTGFVGAEVLLEDARPVPVAEPAAEAEDASSRSVRFSWDESVAEAASAAAPDGEHRSIRNRTPTAFVHPEATQKESGVSFAANDEMFEVGTVRFGPDAGLGPETESEGELKPVRDRIPTAWVSSDMIPSVHFDDRCVRFNECAADPSACSARSVEESRLSSRATTAWTDTSSNKSLAESDSTCSSGTRAALLAPPQGLEENEISDVETMSSCSSRNPRSRLSTPHVSPSFLSFPAPVPSANETPKDELRAQRRRPRSRNTSQTASESERVTVKQVSIESSIEREISERVRRNAERQERDERLLRGKIAALGPLGPSRPSLTRTTSNLSATSPLAGGGAMPSGFGMGEALPGVQGPVGRRVPGAVKDSALLRSTFRKLAFFEEFDDVAMHSLIEAMEVYEFEDGEEVVRQGDTDGSHFFVVADGEFVEIRDGMPYCVIGPGCCFGESVLVLFGERAASVRSRARARAYAMEGMAVREMLREQFEQKRTAVIDAVDEMLASTCCRAFAQLNAYQLQRLYDEVTMRSYKQGEIILSEGVAPFPELMVLISGTVSTETCGEHIEDLEGIVLLGDRGLLFHEQTRTVVAKERVELLVLKTSLLEGIFGDELSKVLLRDRIMKVLSQHKVFGRLHEEQREDVMQKCEIRSLGPGEKLEDENLRFVACLHGEVESVLLPLREGAEEQPRQLSRSSTAQWSTFGDENLQHRERPYNIRVQATGATSNVKLAVWHGKDLDSILSFHDLESALEVEDKVRVLKSLFLFQTLSKQQLMRLASALQTKMVGAGERAFAQGEIGTHLYIIRKGLVLIEINGNKIRTMGMGDYFGERALLSSEPRTATVSATEDCELWMMDKLTFQEVMQGPCLDYLTARIALQDTRLNMTDLEFVRVIGRGGFGVVKMVKAARTGLRYALKCVRKRDVVDKGLQDALISEHSILAEVDHPFIVKFVRSFKNATRVYFLMEVVTGGELLDALDSLGLLKHDQAQFYTSSIILALEFLHARRIAYLDLKSENCLIDHQGYLKIIDFGIAQRIVGNRCHVVKGTPIFMAPEMVLGRGYTTVADLWSLGICLYEFLIGDFPFGNNNMNHGQIFHEVLRGQLCFPTWFESQPHAEESMSILRGLLTRDPAQRLGAAFDGYMTLKNHSYFKGLDWDRLLGRELPPPFIPQRETYAEDKEGPGDNLEGSGVSIWDMEANDHTDDDWTDPNPGWDDEF